MLYVEVFVNTGQTKIWSILLVLAGLWIPASINLSGIKNTGSFEVVATIAKFIGLAFMADRQPAGEVHALPAGVP